MLIFRKDSINVIRTSLAELSTLASPTYLIEMISDQSLISTTCIAADTSAYPSRYNEFTITETATPNNLNAEILLEPLAISRTTFTSRQAQRTYLQMMQVLSC